jgi:hypothetical protein
VGYVLGVGAADLGADRPDVMTPDLRGVHWRGDGLEIGCQAPHAPASPPRLRAWIGGQGTEP